MALLCKFTTRGFKINFHQYRYFSKKQGSLNIFNRSSLKNIFPRKLNRSVAQLTNEGKRSFIKPMIFACAFGCGTFTCCTIIQYERIRYSMINRGLSTEGYYRGHKELSFRAAINSWWNKLGDGQKLVTGIIAINACIFACWQIPAFRHFMTKWFTANAFNGRNLPMFLSTFSHAELWHLGCNMIVLWSFALPIHDMLGSEQFVAFYLSAGVFASLCSHGLKLITRSPVASLGASGALLAVLGAVCVERPDARLAILFLPFFSFSAQTALMSIIAVDVAGLLFRWKLFDHGAHLGGTLFGIWYVKYGHHLIWDNRTPLLNWWHKMREGSGRNSR